MSVFSLMRDGGELSALLRHHRDMDLTSKSDVGKRVRILDAKMGDEPTDGPNMGILTMRNYSEWYFLSK